jgi:hypothetical protein
MISDFTNQNMCSMYPYVFGKMLPPTLPQCRNVHGVLSQCRLHLLVTGGGLLLRGHIPQQTAGSCKIQGARFCTGSELHDSLWTPNANDTHTTNKNNTIVAGSLRLGRRKLISSLCTLKMAGLHDAKTTSQSLVVEVGLYLQA